MPYILGQEEIKDQNKGVTIQAQNINLREDDRDPDGEEDVSSSEGGEGK